MTVKEQILKELAEIESKIADLKGSEKESKGQTNLEIAILKEQVSKMSESKKRASVKIDKAIEIIRNFK